MRHYRFIKARDYVAPVEATIFPYPTGRQVIEREMVRTSRMFARDLSSAGAPSPRAYFFDFSKPIEKVVEDQPCLKKWQYLLEIYECRLRGLHKGADPNVARAGFCPLERSWGVPEAVVDGIFFNGPVFQGEDNPEFVRFIVWHEFRHFCQKWRLAGRALVPRVIDYKSCMTDAAYREKFTPQERDANHWAIARFVEDGLNLKHLRKELNLNDDAGFLDPDDVALLWPNR